MAAVVESRTRLELRLFISGRKESRARVTVSYNIEFLRGSSRSSVLGKAYGDTESRLQRVRDGVFTISVGETRGKELTNRENVST